MAGEHQTGQTTRTEIAPAPQYIYDRAMLKRALDYLAYELFGQEKSLPKKSGERVKFSVFDSLPMGVKLAEGTNPSAYKMSKSTRDGYVYTYGGYVEIAEEVEVLTQDKELLEAAELNGEAMGLTLDTICRDIICAGTAVKIVGDAERAALDAYPTKAEFDAALLVLKNAKAKMFSPVIPGSPKVGSSPIRDSYYAISSFYTTEYLETTLFTGGTDGKFIPVAEYPDLSSVQKNEQGSYRNLRFIATTNAAVFEGGTTGSAGRKKTAAGNNEVHATLMLGRDAFGKTPIDGKGSENIVKPRSVAGGPLERFSTSGWKALVGYLILVEAFMYRYEHCVVG